MLHLACTRRGSDVRHLRQHAALQRLSPSRYHAGSFKPQSSHAEVTTCKQGATVLFAQEDASQTVVRRASRAGATDSEQDAGVLICMAAEPPFHAQHRHGAGRLTFKHDAAGLKSPARRWPCVYFVCVRPISTGSIQQQVEWQHIQHERQPSKQSRTRMGYCGSRDV